MQTPIPSMILRDTSIREQSSSSSIKDSQPYFRGSSYNNNINNNNNSNSGYNSSSTYSSRERDCSSPFLNSSSGSNSMSPYNNNSNQLSLGSRENNSIILRDSGVIHQHSPRVASNRFLSGGLDAQRIIKQSTEDCRRLLQQVSVYYFKRGLMGFVHKWWSIFFVSSAPPSSSH